MIVDQRRHAVARRLGQADVARDHRVEHDLAEAGADIVGDLADRLLRRSYMVSATPRIDSSGLKRARIRSTVCSSWLSPSSAKNSACSGTRIGLRGDQRVDRQQAERGRAIDQADVPAARRRARRARCRADGCGRSKSTSSISAPDRSTVAGTMSSRGTRVATTASSSAALAGQQLVARAVALRPGRCRGRSRRCPADRGRSAARASRSRRARWRG